jgi:hypothetical protein
VFFKDIRDPGRIPSGYPRKMLKKKDLPAPFWTPNLEKSLKIVTIRGFPLHYPRTGKILMFRPKYPPRHPDDVSPAREQEVAGTATCETSTGYLLLW